MLIYLLIFAIALLYYFVAKGNKNPLLLAFFFVFLSLFVGLGDMIGGYDRFIYGASFDAIADNIRAKGDLRDMYYLVSGNEYGYFFYQVLLAYITPNRYIFIFVTTLLIYIFYYRAFKKYIEEYPLACILFLAFLFFFTMTYLRAVLAIGIMWQGLKYIWERNLLKFTILIFIAYLFHSSALIFFPIYFIPQKKWRKNQIVLFLVISLLIGLTPLPITIVSSAGEFSGKLGEGSNYSSQEQGFRPEYVMEVIFFLWFLFKNYKYIIEDKKNTTFLNMLVVFCGLLLFFMRFGQGGRFTWPFLIGVFYLFPKLAIMSKQTSNKGILISVSFLLFLRFVVAWSPMNIPYKTFLENGTTAGDGNVAKYYEYDWKYSKDKFYRPIFDPVF